MEEYLLEKKPYPVIPDMMQYSVNGKYICSFKGSDKTVMAYLCDAESAPDVRYSYICDYLAEHEHFQCVGDDLYRKGDLTVKVDYTWWWCIAPEDEMIFLNTTQGNEETIREFCFLVYRVKEHFGIE